jgi:aspartate-semialdehyde dehydrogenase
MTKTTHEGGARSTASGAPWGWTPAHRAQRVAIVGATGAVGRELSTLLVEAGHAPERIACFARRNDTIRAGGRDLAVKPLAAEPTAATWKGTDLVFLCTPSELSIALAPALKAARVRTIDLSSAFRMHPDVPLVVPEINAGALSRAAILIANPNCTTAIACMPLAVIARVAGLDEVIVVSFQAASGAGVPGLQTLDLETRESVGAPVPETRPKSPFAATLAWNVIPAVSEPDATGTSGEERKVIDETRRILGLPDLVVECTTTRVPVERCHSVAVHVRTQREFDLAALTRELESSPGIVVTRDPHGPRPRECAGLDPVFVGRIRAGSRGSRSLCFFAVGDQIRKGAALNALQVAAALPPASPSS